MAAFSTLAPALPQSPIDPLHDPRWADLLQRHPKSSVFHSVPWLDALRRTYGFQPVVLTTSPPGAPLDNGLALCRVQSWLTGRRLVSLPFSDHCDPLVDTPAAAQTLVADLNQALSREKLRYVELRGPLPIHQPASTADYCFHQLDLSPDLDTLFANCHKSSTQRKVERARRDGLTYESGHSPALLRAFWDLFLITRRRHGVPPQPLAWFRNLIACFGDALQIRVAFHGHRPAAAILTLRHKDTLVYKYGCSDPALNQMGGTHLLFWRSIEEAKSAGLRSFDLGRTDLDNSGLITFKDRWGAARSTITYTRLSARPADSFRPHSPSRVSRIAAAMPLGVLKLAGHLLYRHMA